MGQHVAVQLTGEERNTLEQRLKGGQGKARSQTRARVLLLLDLPELLSWAKRHPVGPARCSRFTEQLGV